MSAGRVAVPSIGLATPARLSILTAVFAVGIAVGLAAPRMISGPTGAGEAATAGPQAKEITPVLDTSKGYTTVQNGALVPPGEFRLGPGNTQPLGVVNKTGTFSVTPVLDTSKPYLTIQHGILVLPTSASVSTPVLDTSKPYTTIQHVTLVPSAS